MKRRIVRGAALALVAGATLVPTMASADPVVSITIAGTPFVDGGTGTMGQNVTLAGSGCQNPTPGQPTYMGLFIAAPGDDPNLPTIRGYETQTNEANGFSLDSVIDVDAPGVQQVRFYCSTAQVTAVNDPSMLWVSPVVSMSVQNTGAQPAALRTALTSTVALASTDTASARTTSGGSNLGVVVKTDPNALPLIDKMGIVGKKAAALKAKVDASTSLVARAENLHRAFYRRTATHTELAATIKRFRAGETDKAIANSLAQKSEFTYTGDRAAAITAALAKANSPVFKAAHANENYVLSAFRSLADVKPSPSQAAKYTRQLKAGMVRVQVIEDIALTMHGAGWWNSH